MTLPPRARDALVDAVERAVVPGGVAAMVGLDGRVDAAWAGVTREDGPPVGAATRYDLASLTKVVATLPCVLRLVSDGEIALTDRVGRFFANAGWFQVPSLADATVRQLLAHTSGLRNWGPLYARVSTRSTALAAVLQAPLRDVGRMCYTDFGFMLLAAIVERVTGTRLDVVARTLVFAALGMDRTRFGPVDRDDVAATEDCGWRGRLLIGEVHDENATVWDGVAGHAGLFGDVADLGRYAAAWLRLDDRLADPELLREATRPQATGDDGSVRGLGWMLPWPGAFAGQGVRGYGHTGFTGTSLWVDPSAGTASILLTNRIHPHRGRGEGIHALRRAFHAAAHGDSA
jgi:CubicO group peptidase (beta-lactamase class C family)